MFRPKGATVVLLVVSLAGIALFVAAQQAGQVELRQRKIAFDSTGEDGYAQVYVMEPDGSNLQRLTDITGKGKGEIKGTLLPAWSPNRKKIAFISTRDGPWEIYVMDADGSNQQRLTYTPEIGKGNSAPAWSPDGKKILFNSIRDGNAEIYVMDADGSKVQRLTRNPSKDELGDWSPDGKKIVFTSDRDGNREIYVMHADGSNVHRLTNHPGHDAGLHWSPDGERIVFQSDRHVSDSHLLSEGHLLEVYVMDAEGSNIQRLTSTRRKDKRSWFPVWSPDGKKIAFHSNRDGTSQLAPAEKEGEPVPFWKRENWFEYEIYVMDADGSNVRRLTFNKKIDLHPDW